MPYKSPLLAQYAELSNRPTGWEAAPGAMDSIRTNADATANRVGEMVEATQVLPNVGNAPQSNTRIAYNEREKAFLVNGQKLPFNGATLRALAEVEDGDLPEMDGSRLPPGYTSISPAQVRSFFNRIRDERETSFGKLLGANAASAAGAAVTAIPRILGIDAKNPLGDMEQKAYDGMSLREQVGADETTFESGTGFINDLGRGLGSVAPALLVGGGVGMGMRAAGAAAAASETGMTIAGGAMGAGAAYDTQSEAAQARLAQMLVGMPEEQLMQELPEYAELRGTMSREDAIATLAFNSGQAAGTAAAAWTVPETLVGGQLAKGMASKIPGLGRLIGLSEQPGLSSRFLLRTPAAGVGEGLQEYFEDPISQVSADRYAGIESDPAQYLDTRSFTSGMATGLFFGALGGGGKSPAQIANADPLGAALRATQTPAERDSGMQGAVMEGDQGVGQVDPQVRLGQLENLLSERGGPNWRNNVEYLAQMPSTRHLLGEYIATQREVQQAQGGPAYERRDLTQQVGAPPVSPGAPSLQGPAFGDADPNAPDPIGDIVMAFSNNDTDTLQQMFEAGALNAGTIIPAAARLGIHPQLMQQRIEQMAAGMGPPNGPVSEDDGLRVSPNMRERRAFSQMGIDERAAASQENPALLPGSPVAELEREIADLEQVLTQRWGPNWDRNPAMKKSPRGRSYADAYNSLVAEWEQAKLDAGPQGVDPALRVETPQQPQGIGTPAPAEAPTATMPDGRPIGVTPDPIANPEPMAPGEAEARAQAQAERGVAGPIVGSQEPALAAPEAPVAAAIAKSKKGVSKTTAEPDADIRAQVEAMIDPASDKDSVFIADGDPNLAKWRNNGNLPDDVRLQYRPGTGLLMTTSPIKSHLFADRKVKMTDARLAQILGYTETKADVATSGEQPVVVRAVGKDGAVSTEQGATPSKVEAAKAAAKRLGRPGDTVEVTTPDEMQKRRKDQSAPAASLQPKVPKAKVDHIDPDEREAHIEELVLGLDSGPDEAKDSKERVLADLEQTGVRSPKAELTKLVAEARTRISTRAAERAKANEPAPKAVAAAKGRAREVASEGAKKAKSKKAVAAEEDRAEPVDLRERATTKTGNLSVSRGEPVTLTGSLLRTSGAEEGPMRTHVQRVDEQLVQDVANALDSGRLSGDAREVATKILRNAAQLRTMLEAAVAAASDRMKARFAKEGHVGKFAGDIVAEPLSPGEMVHFAKLTRAQAKFEMGREGWTMKKSVFRRAVAELMPDVAQLVNNETAVQKLMKIVSELPDEQLEKLTLNWGHRLKDSVLAKEIMRGGTEIAASMEATRGYVPKMTSDVQMSHITKSKGIGEAAANVLNGWVQMIERTHNLPLKNIRLMTIKELRERYPEARGYVGAHGLHLPVVKYGKVREHVIAIDWTTDALSTEILAHEFGHVLTDAVLRASNNETQRAVKQAYEAWVVANGGKSTYDILRSRLTGLRAELMSERTTLPSDYSLSFREWSADNIARFLLTNKEPKGVVEKFFADVAKMLRGIYEKIVGKNAPEKAWQDAMDLWLGRTAAGIAEEPVDPWAGLDPDERKFFEKWVDGGGKGRIEEARSESFAAAATEKLSAVKDAVAPLLDPKATKEARAAARGWLMSGNTGRIARKVMLSLVSPHQMADIYAGTPAEAPLRRLVNLRDRIAAYARELQKGSDRAHQVALSLSRESRDLLEQLMYKATYYNANPEVPFEHANNKHLTVDADARVTESNRRRHAEVAALYERLKGREPAAVEAYTALRDSLVDIRKATLDQKLENLSHFKGSKTIIEKLKAQLETERDRKVEGPYFPLMRKGNYIVKATLPMESYGRDGKLIAHDAEMFDSKTQAEKEKSVLQQLYPGAEIHVKQDPDGGFYLQLRPSAVYFFNTERQAHEARAEIEREVRAEYEHAGIDFDESNEILKGNLIGHPFPKREDFEQRKQHTDAAFWRELESVMAENNVSGHLRDAIEELYLESLPEFSFRKSMLTRERILGASKDMLEAHAHRSGAASYALAEIRDSANVSKARAELDKVGRSGFSQAIDAKNAILRGEQLASARGRKSTGNAIANAITDANAFFSLALSPAYVLTNAMQPTMVTLPFLAGMQGSKGTVGLANASAALRGAYAQAGTYFTKKGWQDFKDEISRLRGKSTEIDPRDFATEILDRFAQTDGKPDPQLRAVLQGLLERGRLDFSFLNSMEDALRGGHSKWGTVMRLGMAFPQQIEAMNRVTSAIAAYRVAHDHLGAKDGEVQGLPIEAFVDRVVLKTQLDYSTKNRPWAFNLPVLNVLLQFKLYLQGMYMLFVESGLKMARGTKAEKKQGAMTMAYLLAMHGAVGGLAGVGPVSGLAKLGVSALALAFGDDDDEFKDTETLMRQFLTEYVGEDLGEVALRGAPTLIGLDVADRIGLPNLWDSKYANISERDTPAQGFDKAFLYALGSPYANARRVYTGAADPMDKGLDALPAGLRAIARAAKYGVQGIVDHDGDQFIPRDELNWGQIGASALGFQPAEISRAYRERNTERDTKGRIEIRREEILKAFRTGALVGAELREEVAKFNATVPPPFRIKPDTLQKSKEGKAARDAGEQRKPDAAIRKLTQ